MTHSTIAVGASVHVQRQNGGTFDVSGKPALVLAMLALEGQVERRRLALLLWPDSAQQQALNNLRTLVHRLNQRFESELVAGAEHLRIDTAQARLTLQDSDEVLAALGAGGPERCELLAAAGIDTGASEALGNWFEAARQRLRRLQLAGLGEALEQALTHRRSDHAVALAHACVQLEPLSEQWHRQLMDTLVRCGDRAAALVAYEDCKTRLRQALGVMPDLQTRAVHLRILQDQALDESIAQAPGPALAQPAPPAAPVAMTAMPTRLGGAARYPLVERETVLADVQAALAQGLHVALSGEAGVGKTRLLRQLAEQAEPHGMEQVVIRPGARNEPYAALAHVLQDVQPRRAMRIGVPEQIELARLAPLAFPEVQPSRASLSAPRLHAALRHWAGRLREAGVQRLVLDDVHYADAASQAAFAALLAPPEGAASAPPALLLAHRTDEIDPALAEALVAAQVHHQARCVALPRLSLHGVTALLEAMHAEHSQAHAAQLLQRTGGNPLFVIELAQHALEQAAQATTDPASANLDALLRSRLASCSAAAQQLAAVAAVAAAEFSVELAAAVMAQPPLSLMQAWTELQHRGLFADHGLAHDLVREVALGTLPVAIGQTLQRQVAGYLEGLGLEGAQVLRHLLLAQEYDRALPHALQQLHATSAAGLSARHLEVDLLGLMERLSDSVLLDKLWATAEIQGNFNENFAPPEVWNRMQGLIERVGRLVNGGTAAAWQAYERSRVLRYRDSAVREAYAVLSPAAERMDARSTERARAELFLALLANNLNGRLREHTQRARAAAEGLPNDLPHARLKSYIESVCALTMSPLETIKAAASRMRVARRRGDLGGTADARYQIATLLALNGFSASPNRLFGLDSNEPLYWTKVSHEPLMETVVALCAGRFEAAIQCIDRVTSAALTPQRPLFLAMVWLRLGQWSRCRAQVAELDDAAIQHQFFSLHLGALLRLDLDHRDGNDPLPALRQALATMQSLGIEGVNLQLMVWELASRTLPARERVAEGMKLIGAMRAHGAYMPRLPRALLDVAEAHADTHTVDGSSACRALVLEAARELRRGRTTPALYLPDGLVRCAKLLQASDPDESARLMHVARRWVRQALPHVPDFARASFVAEVPVNRLLLAGDHAVTFPKGRA